MAPRPRPVAPVGLARAYHASVKQRLVRWHAALRDDVLASYAPGGTILVDATRHSAAMYTRAKARASVDWAEDALAKDIEAVGQRVLRRGIREQSKILRLPGLATPQSAKLAVPIWREANVDLIQSIPKEDILRMDLVLEKAYSEGWPVADLAAEIESQFSVTSSRAALIARDQTMKLNAQITQETHLSVGVTEYTWSTSRDSRVRDGHRSLDKTRHSYSDPPVVDDKGRRAHPGEDYQCRCVAIPILPWE